MTLLEECIEVLKNNIYILPGDEQENIEEIFFDTIPFTNWEELIGVELRIKKILNLLKN